jgi:hypothetical protein
VFVYEVLVTPIHAREPRRTMMLSLLILHALNQQQAQRAASDQLLPLVVEAEDRQSGDRLVTHLRRMPNLGEHRPTGWTLERTLVVDAFYLGRQGDGVLSFVQFLGEVRVGCGYAILQGGRHSHVGEFTRTGNGKARTRRKPQGHKEGR